MKGQACISALGVCICAFVRMDKIYVDGMIVAAVSMYLTVWGKAMIAHVYQG